MKLHIHAGLHKTATSSFQLFCDKNRKQLTELGLLYPKFRFWQHGELAWWLQQGREDDVRDHLLSIRRNNHGCHSCLLSGEDFENYILDVHTASTFEKIALASGFESVSWHIVTREIDAMVQSLYGELSKQNVVVDLATLKKAAHERGAFFASHKNYNFIFVLDYQRFQCRFRSSVTSVYEYKFEDFCKGDIGSVLIQEILHPDDFEDFLRRNWKDVGNANERQSELQIELNYLATKLGLPWLKRRRYRPVSVPALYLLNSLKKMTNRTNIS